MPRQQTPVGYIATRPRNSMLKDIHGNVVPGASYQRCLSPRTTEMQGTNEVRLSPRYELTAFEIYILTLERIARNPALYPEEQVGKRPRAPLVSEMSINLWIAKRVHRGIEEVANIRAAAHRTENKRLVNGLAPAVDYTPPPKSTPERGRVRERQRRKSLQG